MVLPVEKEYIKFLIFILSSGSRPTVGSSITRMLGSFSIWSNLRLIGGRDVLDSEDFLVSNLLLPLGSLVYLMFCVSRNGWGYDRYLEECNAGKGLKMSRWLKPYFQFVLPILILFILIQGLL